MDSSKLDENPREKASVLSVLSFYWTFGLFRKGYSKVLQLDDLIRPLNADRSERLGNLLNRQVFLLCRAMKEMLILCLFRVSSIHVILLNLKNISIVSYVFFVLYVFLCGLRRCSAILGYVVENRVCVRLSVYILSAVSATQLEYI